MPDDRGGTPAAVNAVFRTYSASDALRSDRSARDRQRHRQKVRKAIRENIADVIAEEAIISQRRDKVIKVPLRGIKEYRAPEALALIAGDRAHQPLVCPSCGPRTIQRSPRRRASPLGEFMTPERISLTCAGCSRHAYYITRGKEPPRHATMDPRSL